MARTGSGKKSVAKKIMQTVEQRSCEWCGELFWAERSSARFCSARCRMASHRAGKK
jgi:hypothetical protein